jgi:hypothetical protein
VGRRIRLYGTLWSPGLTSPPHVCGLAQGGGAKSLRRSAGVKAKAEGGGVDELGGELKRISEKWGNLFQVRARGDGACDGGRKCASTSPPPLHSPPRRQGPR